MELQSITVSIPDQANIIVGQAHFVKTVEDIAEALITSVPQIAYGVGFCEASGACLVRSAANDAELKTAAEQTALQVGAGHCFVVFIRNAYPINVLPAITRVPEVCRIYAATANPLQVLVAQTSQGRGIIGVVDGSSPRGVEQPADIRWRYDLLRSIGYKS